MKLKDKKVLFLGDSITQGVGASSSVKCYVNVFAKNTGASVYNYGISGTRIARQKVIDPDNKHDLDFNMRAPELNDEADVIVVFGGTNDFGHGDAPIGRFEDRDVNSFYGALHYLIRFLYTKYPDAIIVFMTPLHRLSENELENALGLRCEPLSKYVDVIREVCEYYSVPVLDLYAKSGIQPAIPSIRENYMPDGLHPSDKGAERIALMLQALLENLL